MDNKDSKITTQTYIIKDGVKIPVRHELARTVFTEHSLELTLFKEVQFRLYVAARAAIEHAKKDSSFLNGAYLRIILDSATELFMVTCMGLAAQKRFIAHWKRGKPTNKFQTKDGEGNDIQLTTGYIRRNVPIFDELYSELNQHIHPSFMYYKKVVEFDGDNLFINQEVPKNDLTGLEGRVYSLYEKVLANYDELIDKIQPTTDEHRIVKYLDSLMEFKGMQPAEFKVYKD